MRSRNKKLRDPLRRMRGTKLTEDEDDMLRRVVAARNTTVSAYIRSVIIDAVAEDAERLTDDSVVTCPEQAIAI